MGFGSPAPWTEPWEGDDIVSVAPAMREVLTHVERVAVTDSTVLLTGETGVSKELIARATCPEPTQ